MSKVIAFIGSPRKTGNTVKVLEKVVEGAKAAGAEVVFYDLNGDQVKGCQGCYFCRAHDGCATEDALQPMYKDIADADGIVATFPIYFHNISGQAKRWLDRLFPMLNGDFSPRHPGKKVVTIYAQGNPNKEMFKGSIDMNDNMMKMFGWDIADRFLCYGCNAPDYKIAPEMLAAAYAAGQGLVK